MATANLTWTNNATGDSPDSTKIERVKDLGFDHPKAVVEELANGSGGGLDPTSATGSYNDGTVSPYSHYTYRVSTVKGTESSASISTPLEFVYDQANELGYPNGSPSVAPQFNCTVEPVIHIDPSRLGGIDYQDESVWSGTVHQPRHFNKTFPYSLTPALRHNTIGAVLEVATGHAVSLAYVNYNGNSLKAFAKIQASYIADDNGNVKGSGNAGRLQLGMPNYGDFFTLKDEVTVFYVASKVDSGFANLTGPNANPLSSLSDSLTGGDEKVFGSNINGNVAVDGVYYNGASGGKGSGATVNYPSNAGILAYRHNNTLEAFNSLTGTGAQLFVNGGEYYNTGDNNAKSYHQGGTGNYLTHMGAYAMQDKLYSQKLCNPNWNDALLYEYIVFPKILNADDMNAVTGYLCNKYNEPFTAVTDNDLI